MQTIQQQLTRMKTDMQLRGLTEHTQEAYIRSVRKFLEFCGGVNGALDESDAREYLIYLMQEGRLEQSSINLYNAAIRFYLTITLNLTINYRQLPLFKKRKKLPTILSREETQKLIDACLNVKHKSYLLLAYGSGLRLSEIATLCIKDIDSSAMRVFVRGGKGKKDRYTILSNECLSTLREYWSLCRPKHPKGYLFIGTGGHNHITPGAIDAAFGKWLSCSGITKDITIHTLRHQFATFLLEDGVSIFQIKELLGHASLSSTAIYLHLANTTAGVVSPADRYVQYD
jgi:site-specific recombinase XerD